MTKKIQKYIDEQQYLKDNLTYKKFAKELMDEYPNPIDKFGDTPLQHELSSHSYKVTKEKIDFFLDNGIDINHQNKGGETALMIAVKRHSFYIVKYLIDKGANKNLIDIDGKSVFDFIKQREINRQESIEQLNNDWILLKQTEGEKQTMKTKFSNDYKEIQNINSLLNNSNKDIIDAETLDSKDELYSLPKEINFEDLINEEK